MAILILGGWIELWHVYSTAFLLGCCMAINQPVRTSMIPQLLSGTLLLNALSLNSIAINVSKLIGPAGFGLLIAVNGDNVAPAYVVVVVVYVSIIIATVNIDHKSKLRNQKHISFRTEFVEGFRYLIIENRTALALVILATGPLAFAFSYITLLPVLVTDVLNASVSSFGGIQSVGAIGALLGGFWLASSTRVNRKGWIMLSTAMVYGGAVISIGNVKWLLAVFIIAVVIGATQTIFRATNNSTLLEITPQRFQGRVIRITSIDMGIQSVAAIFAGVVTDAYSVSIGMAISGEYVCYLWALSGYAPHL